MTDDATRTMPDGRVLLLASTDVADRLEIRADIRRSISHRKSVEEQKPDRLAILLDQAAAEIRTLRRQRDVAAEDEIRAMRTRRKALLAEDATLHPDRGADRSWAIGNELDNMDDRLRELGIDLDAIA